MSVVWPVPVTNWPRTFEIFFSSVVLLHRSFFTATLLTCARLFRFKFARTTSAFPPLVPGFVAPIIAVERIRYFEIRSSLSVFITFSHVLALARERCRTNRKGPSYIRFWSDPVSWCRDHDGECRRDLGGTLTLISIQVRLNTVACAGERFNGFQPNVSCSH